MWTLCLPDAPGAVEMTWTDVKTDELLEPTVSFVSKIVQIILTIRSNELTVDLRRLNGQHINHQVSLKL